MSRRHLCIAFVLAAFFAYNVPAQAQPPCIYHPISLSETSTTLKRGINLSQWWDEGSNPPRASDIRQLRTLGFDFVRLPISPAQLLTQDQIKQAQRLQALQCDLVMLLDQGMSVILDLHAPSAFRRNNANPELLLSQLKAAWRTMLPALKTLPPRRVLLSLYNEPDMDGPSWWKLQQNLVRALRPVFPRLSFIVSAGPHGSAWELSQMTPYKDHNIVYDFHFYSPMFLTHHGANWREDYTPREEFDHIAYPSNVRAISDDDSKIMRDYAAEGWNRAKLEMVLQAIRSWKKRYRVNVACLEFGVYRAYVEDASRYRWLHDTRTVLENAGIPWALWEYRGGFGLTDAEGIIDRSMARTLGLSTH